tara:strand:+ start:210 stop:515 length:306 start_codon:yes stop_codon:yes gene_type:complete
MSSQRFINLDPSFGPLIHDLLKTAFTVLISGYFIAQYPGLAGQYSGLVAQLIALVIFHTVIEAYVIGAGKPCCPLERVTSAIQGHISSEEPKPVPMEGFGQ